MLLLDLVMNNLKQAKKQAISSRSSSTKLDLCHASQQYITGFIWYFLCAGAIVSHVFKRKSVLNIEHLKLVV